MPERKKTVVKRRKKHPIKKLLSLCIIGISCFLMYAASKDVIIMLNLKHEISANNEQIKDLKEKKDSLSTQKKKLQDPEYVKRYARDKYLVSKKGEQVFKLPGGNNEDDKDESPD